jgi:hypothetical protein
VLSHEFYESTHRAPPAATADCVCFVNNLKVSKMIHDGDHLTLSACLKF